MKEEGKRHYVLITSVVFDTVESSKSYVNDCFKINDKQVIKMPKKGEYAVSKNLKEK